MDRVFEPLIYVLAFIAVVLLIQALSATFFSAKDRNQRVNRRLSLLEDGLNHDEVYAALVRRSRAPEVGGERFRNFYDRLDLYCRQTGMDITPPHLLTITLCVAGGLWVLGMVVATATGKLVFINGLMSMVGALGLALLGVSFWVRGKRNARLKKIEEQLPLALDIVVRAIRAGHPVVSAVHLAANEMGDPLGSEFGLIVDETTYGVEFKEALVNFAHRTGSDDAHFFAVSVGIQSETGGNLAEILDGLATVIRGRNTLGKRVRVLASEGRASAYLLSALPPGMVGIQFLIHPQTYTDKFSDPIFWPTIAVVMVIYMLGWVMIHRIINFKY